MEMFGWHKDLPDESYRSYPALGSTDVKLLYKNPKLYWYAHLGPECLRKKKKTKALDFGTAFHLLCLEPDVYEKTAVIIPYQQDYRSSEARKISAEAKRQAALVEGGFTISFEDHIKAHEMRNNVLKTRFGSLFTHSEAHSEIALFAKDPNGLHLKGKIDRLINDEKIIIDLKTIQCADERMVDRAMVDYMWDVQAAHYLYIASLIDGPGAWDTFVFLVAEKEEPFRTFLKIADPNEFLEYGKRKIKKAYNNYLRCMETGVWSNPEDEDSQISNLELPIFARME